MQKWRSIFSFRKPPTRAAGLDLSAQGLRWVQVCEDSASSADQLRLECHVFEPLATGCLVGGQIIDSGEVEAALSRLLAQVPQMRAKPGASPAALALAIPDSLVTTQRLRVAPQLREAERLAQVQMEMASILRCDAADLCVDFKSSPDDGTVGAELTLIAAAVPQAAVEDRIAVLEAAGLLSQPAVMAAASEAAALAAWRVIQGHGVSPQTVVALIQLEPSALRLDLIAQAQVLHSHLFDWVRPLSDRADEAAASPNWLKGVVVQAQEDAAAVVGTDVAEEVLEVWDGQGLPAGMLQAIEAGRAEYIWVAGPVEQASAWVTTLRQRATLPCAVLDAFEAMEQAESPALPLNDGPESLVACGLALTALRSLPSSRRWGFDKQASDPLSFNFLPHREKAWLQRQRFFFQQVGGVALLVLLTSVAVQLMLSAQVQTRQEVLAESAMEVAKVEAELKRNTALVADTASLQRNEAALLTFMRAPHETPLLLEELSALLPEGLHLTALRRDAQGDAILSGQANSAAEVFAFIERLSLRSQHFKRPTLLDLSLMPAMPALPSRLDGLGTAGSERVMFILQAYSR